MALPQVNTLITDLLTNDATIDVWGAWVEVLTLATAITAVSVRGPFLNTGVSNFPNNIELDIGVGPNSGAVVRKLKEMPARTEDAGSTFTSARYTPYLIPFSLNLNDKVWCRVRHRVDAAIATAMRFQVTFIE